MQDLTNECVMFVGCDSAAGDIDVGEEMNRESNKDMSVEGDTEKDTSVKCLPVSTTSKNSKKYFHCLSVGITFLQNPDH